MLDWSKCFDRTLVNIVLRIAEELGMPSNVLSGLVGFYGQLSRRFRIAGHVGGSFKATNGIVQG